MPIIDIQNVSKSFKEVHASQNVSLAIESGEYVGILGPNGAGKTTLVEMIEGIQTPDSGTITIMGKNWKDHAGELRKNVGISLQETQLIDKLTVIEILNLFASFYGEKEARSREVLAQIGLEEKKNSSGRRPFWRSKTKIGPGIGVAEPSQNFVVRRANDGVRS